MFDQLFYRTLANQSQFFQPHRDPIPESSAFFRCWRIAGRRLLPTLQALLFSSVLLLQLSRLLLVFLLQLLPPRIISPHLRQPLVVLLLFLLELASLLFLARLELLLVSLVFLVQLRVSCVGKARARSGRNVVRMERSNGTRCGVAAPRPRHRARSSRHICPRRSLGRYYAVSPEFRRSRGSSNGRFSVIRRFV